MKIAAVVVTRNRIKLLERCLNSLLAQTRKLEHIYVVDMDSSDGTLKMLAELYPAIEVIPMKENLGGATGFHTGLSQAFDNGFDWIWCMDDDGFASADALAQLEALFSGTPADWLNSMVVSEVNEHRLAFHVYFNGLLSYSRRKCEEVGIIEGQASPFNGTLLSRRLVGQIGLPLKELFIKGDEQEYLRRAKSRGFRVCTAAKSVFFHPESDALPLSATELKHCWKFYYAVRNHNASISSDNRAKLSFDEAYKYGRYEIVNLIKTRMRELKTMMKSMFGGDFVRIYIIIRAILAAAMNDFKRRFR